MAENLYFDKLSKEVLLSQTDHGGTMKKKCGRPALSFEKKMLLVSFRLPQELLSQLAEEASKRGISKTSLLEAALQGFLNKEGETLERN